MAEWIPSDSEKYMILVPDHADEYQSMVTVLLDLADDPRFDVASTSDYEHPAVIVSYELYELYQRYQQVSESSSPKEPKKKGAKS